MAVCGDKDMAQLGAIWWDNLQSCNIRLLLHFVIRLFKFEYSKYKKHSKNVRTAQKFWFQNGF